MESDEEEIVVPDEDKVKIAIHLIKKTAPGQSIGVAAHLQNLLGNQVLNDEMVNEAYRLRAIDKLEFAKNSPLVHADTHDGEGGFVDPDTGDVLTYNFSTLTLENQTPDPNFQDDPLRRAVSDALKAYCDNHYLQEFHASKSCVALKTDNGVKCLISSKNVNLGSFWSGSWISEYEIEGNTINGTIKLQCHYFESGNVQCNSIKQIGEEVEYSDDNQQYAANIVSIIEREENEYQTALSEFHAANKTAFKKVRRALTIQGTKFDWRLSVHDVVGQMS